MENSLKQRIVEGYFRKYSKAEVRRWPAGILE